MRIIRLNAEYFCYPLWEKTPGLDPGDINPNDLPLSDVLKRDIIEWAEVYNSSFNSADPANSAFDSPDTDIWFEQEKKRILRELKRELGPEFKVFTNDEDLAAE
ncbi:hypothetical protein [Halotalea alkalilenta]|uniref:hypothetical protein n=1 Tax=Halotalea alkalilenta TaxID=376489 RepID=UPI0012DBF6D6|nr:hypothetical protein [Halotalea alkalilenta]